jgi:hypothetical protein
MNNINKFMLHSGATFSVVPKNQLNTSQGFIAKLEWDAGNLETEGLDPITAIKNLDKVFIDPEICPSAFMTKAELEYEAYATNDCLKN